MPKPKQRNIKGRANQTLPSLTSAYCLLSSISDLPPEPCKTDQARAKKEHGSRFGYRV
jgi:hypothetical protein